MCKWIQGNRCSLGRYCHCHPVYEPKEEYDDGYTDPAVHRDYGENYYSEQDDTMYTPLRVFNEQMSHLR